MTTLSGIRLSKQAQSNKVNTNATVTGASTIDLSISQFQKLTITGNTTFTFSNATASKYNILILELVNGGNFTITWPGTIAWNGGTAPTLNASGTDVIVLISSDGTNWKAIRSWRT